MSTIYIAMINDRHADPEPEPFSTAEAAITYARNTAREYNRHEQDYQEHDPPPAGWLFYATYSVEGDSVWVLANVVDCLRTISAASESSGRACPPRRCKARHDG